ncbi:MAG TPA: ABC transporter ATP-binding protein [Acidimicrobiales bacterium]|jgi:branched-chain amino acid transport system ATP-binding protein|nr:ABC transporter ATP-binding protein [Acidimicrobiales bacterium]
MSALLHASNISLSFSGIKALNDVSLRIDDGELVGLIGPNGAGKTTLFNCMFGVLRPDQGSVHLGGQTLGRMPTFKRARLGFGRTFQRIELFTGMTPREHLLLADQMRDGKCAVWRDVVGLSRPKPDARKRVDATLALLGLDDCADRPIESLSLGRGRLVEVGRALMTEPRLLLLDEPSSGLDRSETAALTETLRNVHRERGAAVLLVEHDVEMVRQFVERIYVLDFGTVIAEGPTAEVLNDRRVREAYLGELATSGSES